MKELAEFSLFVNESGFVIHIGETPVILSFGMLVLAALMLFVAARYIKTQFPGERTRMYVLFGSGAMLFVMGSLALHEYAHAVVAQVAGYRIVESGFTWWGAYVKPDVPTSKMLPGTEVFLALAGPAANFVLAAISAYFVWLLKESLVENAVQFVSFVNYRLGLFNLIPIAGLDGSKVLHGLCRHVVSDGAADMIVVLATGVSLSWYFSQRRSRRKSRVDELLERL